MRPILLVLCVCVSACTQSTMNTYDENPLAYVPVYAQPDQLEPIKIGEPRPTENAGKIYVYQQYILQNEQFKGIHIIDNANPAQPVKIAFLSIPFNTEMAIKSNRLFANSINDLVVINLTDPTHPQEVSRIKSAFPLISQSYPPDNGLFVCPDPAKGIVVDWIQKRVERADCRR